MKNFESDDALKELLRQAKELAVRYYRVTGKPLGVTREIANIWSQHAKKPTCWGIRAPHPPPKLCGVNERSNTFHSSYLSGGSMLNGWHLRSAATIL